PLFLVQHKISGLLGQVSVQRPWRLNGQQVQTESEILAEMSVFNRKKANLRRTHLSRQFFRDT
ncbi:MAG: hypothetical protein KJ936_10780, partial [Proteobacteria bacterium]|nr:hypothetical protein [Pseudomonadota bacterium]MBU2228128.1 hypothetical protein [Pseudomonadota bacterium]